MNKNYLLLIISAVIAVTALVLDASHLFNSNHQGKAMTIKLPEPSTEGAISLEECLYKRRSIRSYKNEPLSLAEVSQLLWAAQGITADSFYRTAPSAGARYPLEVYLVAGNVTGLQAGIYYYKNKEHALEMKKAGDSREKMRAASWDQSMITEAPVSIFLSAVFSRVTAKYGDRGRNYVYMEAGHAGQNIYLQSYALGCGTVAIGAFDDNGMKELFSLPPDQEPLYVFPVGKIK